MKVAKTGVNGKLSTFKTLAFNEHGDLCTTKEVRDPEKGWIRVIKDIVYKMD